MLRPQAVSKSASWRKNVHIRQVTFWNDESSRVLQGCYITERSCVQLDILWQTQSPLLFQKFFLRNRVWASSELSSATYKWRHEGINEAVLANRNGKKYGNKWAGKYFALTGFNSEKNCGLSSVIKCENYILVTRRIH